MLTKWEKSVKKWEINPEILSDKATHTFRGVKVKVFTHYTKLHPESLTAGAEIMEGPDKDKWTTVVRAELIKLEDKAV